MISSNALCTLSGHSKTAVPPSRIQPISKEANRLVVRTQGHESDCVVETSLANLVRMVPDTVHFVAPHRQQFVPLFIS